MSNELLICTDLDRTLIPNGPEPESADAREKFRMLASREEVRIAYVSGRHRELVEQAIRNYCLPIPDFVIGDVGTTIYFVGESQQWERDYEWEQQIALDWAGKSHADLRSLLSDFQDLRTQELHKQNHYKLSYYVPLNGDKKKLASQIHQRFRESGVHANLIWSVDEPAGVGLLDILPGSASKYHAIETLMHHQAFTYEDTVFCGDSGNDLEVLASPIPAVLVANSQPEIQDLAQSIAEKMGHFEQLYLARGGFMGMNGNYSAGMLEGIAHYHPRIAEWLSERAAESALS